MLEASINYDIRWIGVWTSYINEEEIEAQNRK